MKRIVSAVLILAVALLAGCVEVVEPEKVETDGTQLNRSRATIRRHKTRIRHKSRNKRSQSRDIQDRRFG